MNRNLALSFILMPGLSQVVLDASGKQIQAQLCKVSVSEGINTNEIIKLN